MKNLNKKNSIYDDEGEYDSLINENCSFNRYWFKSREDNGFKRIMNEYRRLPLSVRTVMDYRILEMLMDATTYLQASESPIEAMLYIALENHRNQLTEALKSKFCTIFPQFVIEIPNKGKVRVDFAIWGYKGSSQYVVECDGFDFHYKTKQQSNYDRQRERDLMSIGWEVIRFTGSQIYEDPFGCCCELEKIIKSKESKKEGET